MNKFKYLKRVNENCYQLDHKLCPEVSAMFAAMASRAPDGGIEARYRQVVEVVAKDIRSNEYDIAMNDKSDDVLLRECQIIDRYTEEGRDTSRNWNCMAEERLTMHPLDSVVQEFFDKFVGQYGHSSVQELTGSPAVYVQGVSPFTAYLSFDNPLVMGQEFSTRAVRRKDWPMCSESSIEHNWIGDMSDASCIHCGTVAGAEVDSCKPHPELKALHEAWLEVFEAEVEAWKVELQKPCSKCLGRGHEIEGTHRLYQGDDCIVCEGTGKKYPWIKDPQAFRPALDRARWAIPSTIATGFCHTANTRVMGRVIQTGMDFSNNSQVWKNIKETYEEALPGMAGMWLREAVVGQKRQLPTHLKIGFTSLKPEVLVSTRHVPTLEITEANLPKREPKGYLDPLWNQLVQVDIEFQCSWAVARDWHRHRTAYPWRLNIVQSTDMEAKFVHDPCFLIHPAYKALATDDNQVEALLEESMQMFLFFQEQGDMEKAMCCLPLGTLVSMKTTMGLRDAVYMLELRAHAHGANFEYEAQAKKALNQLKKHLGPRLSEEIFV